MRIVILFCFLCIFYYGNSQNDTIKIYYNIGQYKLNKKQLKHINNRIDTIDTTTNFHVEIISSCDYLGSNRNNLLLSSKRAERVRDLLLKNKNLIISSIKYKGIGEIASNVKSEQGIKKHRKSLIIFKDETQFILDKMIESETGAVFILKNIIFNPGRHLLKKESLPILKQLLEVMENNPKISIEISGHVCCGKSPLDSLDGFDKDTKTYNLSETRAKHIYNYLVLKKIDTSRLSYKGYGFLKPLIFPETSQEDKANNRRVEIKVINN